MLFLIAGLLIGALAAWWIALARGQAATREALGRASLLEDENGRLRGELADLRSRAEGLGRELERVGAEKRDLDRRMLEREKEYQDLSSSFRNEFENLAHRIFEERTKRFSEHSKLNLEGVVKPLKERIDHFERSIRDSSLAQSRERSALKEQIRQMTDLNSRMLEDARNLTHALKGDTKVQGNWGEMILEKVLEKSGLIRGREYEVQRRLSNEEGRRLQPDVIVHLPEDKKVIIDAKVSLTAWERYISAEAEEERVLQGKAHLDSLRSHIKGLSRKNYQQLYEIKSPDFVLMFVPIEPAFSLALREDEGLYMHAFERNIVIVTPSTLLATLSTVASLWKQEKQHQHVLEIARRAGGLYDKFFGLYNDLLLLGKRLRSSQNAYDDTLKKLSTGKGNLVARVEKLKELGARTQKALPQELLDNAAEDGELPFAEEEQEV